MSRILILCLLFIHIISLITSKSSLIYHCQVESYTEIINLRTCLNNSISINTTRCNGQCYSEDTLIYDWQNTLKYYRHKHYVQCCLPIHTKPREISIVCENKQIKKLKYRMITQCQCKICSDKCLG